MFVSFQRMHSSHHSLLALPLVAALVVLSCLPTAVHATISISSEWNPRVSGVYVRGVVPRHETFFAKAATDDDDDDAGSQTNHLWLFYRDLGMDGYRWYIGDDIDSDNALAYADTWQSNVCVTQTTTDDEKEIAPPSHNQHLAQMGTWMIHREGIWQPDSTFHLECNGFDVGGIDACPRPPTKHNSSSPFFVPCLDLIGSGLVEDDDHGGVQMPVVLLGTAYISAHHGAGAENPAIVEEAPAIQVAIDMGYQGLDLGSQRHPAYANEKLVGDLLAQRNRQSIFITTKLSPSEHGYQSTLRAVQRSLRLLRTDTIDLFLIHHPRCLMAEECEGDWLQSWRAMERLLDLGAVRAIGVSNFDYGLLKSLVGDPANNVRGAARAPVSLVQNRADPLELEDPNLLALCQAHKINYQAFSVLGRQWVVGPWSQYWKAPHPILQNPAVLAIANRLSQELASNPPRSRNKAPSSSTAIIVSPAQVILRWALQKGWSVVPKTAKEERLESNRQLFHFRLSESDMALLDNLQPPPPPAAAGEEL